MRRRDLLVGFAILPLTLAYGCRRGNSPSPVSSSPAAGEPNPATPAAATTPAASAGNYQLIEQWAVHQVPLYPGAQLGQFSPLATQVQNGGTITFVTSDPPEKVREFYRKALAELGWEEKPSPEQGLSARRGDAFLTIVLKGSEGGTTALLMLTDAL